jgi:hypothetical protein
VCRAWLLSGGKRDSIWRKLEDFGFIQYLLKSIFFGRRSVFYRNFNIAIKQPCKDFGQRINRAPSLVPNSESTLKGFAGSTPE